MYIYVLNSPHKPFAYDTNCFFSFLEFHSMPSAILLGIDSPDMVIWSLNP